MFDDSSSVVTIHLPCAPSYVSYYLCLAKLGSLRNPRAGVYGGGIHPVDEDLHSDLQMEFGEEIWFVFDPPTKAHVGGVVIK